MSTVEDFLAYEALHKLRYLQNFSYTITLVTYKADESTHDISAQY